MLVELLLATLSQSDMPLNIYTQDDLTFPADVTIVVDENNLERAYQHNRPNDILKLSKGHGALKKVPHTVTVQPPELVEGGTWVLTSSTDWGR